MISFPGANQSDGAENLDLREGGYIECSIVPDKEE